MIDVFGVVDLETTGVDPKIDRIVTAAAGIIDLRENPPYREILTWLADPGIDIPPEATAVHGITTEHARANGRPLPDVVAEILDALRVHTAPGWPVIGMNLPFDFGFLWQAATDYGITWPWDGAPPNVIDVYVIDKRLDPFRKGGRKLADLARHYGVRLDGAHTADGDALGAARVAFIQRGQCRQVADAVAGIQDYSPNRLRAEPEGSPYRLPNSVLARLPAGRSAAERIREWCDLAAMDLGQLHAAQRLWRAEQAAGLQDYLRTKKGQPDAVVDPCWPLCAGHDGEPPGGDPW